MIATIIRAACAACLLGSSVVLAQDAARPPAAMPKMPPGLPPDGHRG